MAFLIVIQGGPATGKSTLGKKLATDLAMKLITKDNFKEMFYDSFGAPKDRDESTIYGRAATSALYSVARIFLQEKKNVIIESAFTKEFADKDIEELVRKTDASIIQVYCAASPEIRLKRYEARIQDGTRHKGHPDGIGMVSLEDFKNDSYRYGALNIDKTIHVDTDKFDDTDYAKLLSYVKTEM